MFVLKASHLDFGFICFGWWDCFYVGDTALVVLELSVITDNRAEYICIEFFVILIRESSNRVSWDDHLASNPSLDLVLQHFDSNILS